MVGNVINDNTRPPTNGIDLGIPKKLIKTAKPNKPNIIVILADDLGYGDIGAFGNNIISTPNIDHMASEGQKWTNFYAGSSVCTPSRAALLTGRLPLRTGLTSNSKGVLFPNSLNGIPQFEITIAEQLKESNYNTKLVGKWHLGNTDEYFPLNHGFDSWFGLPYSNDMDNVSNIDYWDMWRSDERKKYNNFNVPLILDNKIIERPVNQRTLTKRYLDESLKFIEDNSDNTNSNGYHIGFVEKGEWTKYSVKINSSGIYRVRVRHASEETGGQLYLSLNDQNASPILTTNSSGSWFSFINTTVDGVVLEEGEHSLKVHFNSDVPLNIISLYFEKTGEISSAPFNSISGKTGSDEKSVELFLNQEILLFLQYHW